MENPRLLGLPHDSFRPDQYDAYQKAKKLLENGGGTLVIEAPTGCHPAGQKILMFDGSVKNVEDIIIGDLVMGSDGDKRIVTETISGYGKIYSVTPKKGNTFLVNEDHILTLKRTNLAKRKPKSKSLDGKIIDISVKKYLTLSKTQKHILKLFRVGVPFAHKNLLISPYFMGIILGDGHISGSITITKPDEEIKNEVYNQAKFYNLNVTESKSNFKCKSFSVVGRKGSRNKLKSIIKSYGLENSRSSNKFIPSEYKFSSYDQRLELLAGIIDTDGSLSSGVYDFISKSKRLAYDVAFVSRSVGLYASVKECVKSCQNEFFGTYYRVIISGNIYRIPCKIPRKISGIRRQKKDVLKTGFSISYYGEDYYYGFSLTGDGRYLLDDFTVTHNTGKSGIPTAIGANYPTLVVVHNHGLLKQYERIYGFDIIMGKPEYDCVLKSKVSHWNDVYGLTPTAGDCHFKNMYDCPAASRCPYLQAREKAMQSNRAACTYKYAALSEWIHDRDGVIALDEAHDCNEELIEFAKFTIDDNTVKEFKFNRMPLIGFGQGGKGDVLEGKNRNSVIDWVSDCMNKVSRVDLFMELTQENSKNKKMFDRLSSAMNMLVSDKTLFYKCALPSYDDDDDRFKRPCLNMEIRSLDVKDVMNNIVGKKDVTLMMSATIGNPRPLMSELGIQNFLYVSYKHPTPPNKRPVYDLRMEKMTKVNLDSKPSLYKIQASAISRFISSQDKDWRGIVLTTSNYKINLLRNFLKQDLNGRIMIPKDGSKLNEQINTFINNKDPGKIFVGTIQGWGSGISLEYDIARMAIIAGVPFSNPGDRFEQLRMSTQSGKQYAFWNAYCSVVQATGRVSRGEIDDDGKYMTNVAALADGSATTPIAKSNYPKWFNEAITQFV